MQQGLKSVVVRLQGEQVVTAYLDRAVPSSDEQKVTQEIKSALSSFRGLEIKSVDAAQFILSVRNQYPDLAKELEELGKETSQVIPRYVSISGILTDVALEKIKAIPGVENIESSKDRYHHIVGAFSALRWVARLLMIGIALALFTGLIQLSRMNAYLHKNTLTLLKFWGANTKTLASPGMLAGCLVGVLGGLIAWCGWLTVGTWLTQHIRSLSLMLKGMPQVHTKMELALFLLGGAIGMISGLFGTFWGSLSSSQLNQEGMRQ